MKTICIYHSVDLDGWMSAAIVKLWNNQKRYCSVCEKPLDKDFAGSTQCCGGLTTSDNIDFLGYNYGEPLPDLSNYNKVIMCDISFPVDIMKKLHNTLKNNFIWIDHHKSAIKDITELFGGGLLPIDGCTGIEYAACELTWMYFFKGKDMPEIVRLLGRYDCFGHKGTDEEKKVLEFQYGARMEICNYNDAYNLIGVNWSFGYCNNDNNDINPLMKIYRSGQAIYQYLCTEANSIYNRAFPLRFTLIKNDNLENAKFYEFLCVNQERFNPINFGIDYHKDGYDGFACFHYANGKWNFSLYNDNGEVDCSVIAKQYGGGGHKGAAGFRCNDEVFLKIINNK